MMQAQVRFLVLVWVALGALLSLTVGLSFAPLGPFRLGVSLLIAALKAALIYWVYMDLRKADGIVRIAALAALFFLGVLLLMTGLDFSIRAGALRLG
jgi:cytochrome c oxidase subunit 4